MASQGLFAKKRKSILREVVSFPGGVTNDGVFGHTISSKNYVRAKSGFVTAEEAGIFADGTDQTTRFNQVMLVAGVKVIELYYDGGGTITIAGTVNCQGKTVKFRDGTKIGGAGSLTNFKIDAPDTAVVVNDQTVGLVPATFTSDYISAAWWGVKPNTGVDMTSRLQRVVDFAKNNTRTRKIQIPEAGQYIINDLIVANYISGQAYPVTVSIVSPFPNNAYGVNFYTNNPTSATIHIQTGHNCDFTNILFSGVGPNVDFWETADDAEWGAGGVSIDRRKPHCFVSIDGLFTGPGTTLSPSDYYPGVNPSFYTNTRYGGSTNIRFLGCNYSNFFFGVGQGLSGCPNGEGLQIVGGYGVMIAYFWGAGQLQSREAVIRDFYFIIGHTFLTNICGGDARGDVPSVNNSNICAVRYLFETQANFTFLRFTNGYSESIQSLGKHTGNTPVNFVNWNLTFMVNNVRGTPVIPSSPVLGETGGTISFSGGSVQTQGYRQAMAFNCKRVIFSDGCLLIGGPPMIASRNDYDRITFQDVQWITGGAGAIQIEDNASIQADEDDYILLGRTFLTGSKFISRTNRTYEAYGKKIDKILIPYGIYITVDSASATATFTPTDPGQFLVGDVLMTEDPYNWSGDIYSACPSQIGYVSNNAGGVVTISYVPAGIGTGAYTLSVVRIAKYVPHVMGQLTAGSAVITGFLDAGYGFSGFDRIKGDGIKPGTFVVSVDRDAKTITMSTLAVTSGFVELYDQQVKVTTTDKEFLYFGSPYHWYDIPLMFFKGDEVKSLVEPNSRGRYCVQGGKWSDPTHPPVFYMDGDASRSAPNNFTNANNFAGALQISSLAGAKKALFLNADGSTGVFPMPKIRTVTANATVTADDYTVVVNSSSPVTIGLPAASTVPDRIFNIKRKGTGTVTIDPNGAETIDGAATFDIANRWDNLVVQSDGVEFFII